MVEKQLALLGYDIRDNYYILDTDTLGYKARIIFPYGLADGSFNYYNPYISILLGVLDNFIEFPVQIGYDIRPNTISIDIRAFDLNQLTFTMGSLFNFMKSVDVEEFFKSGLFDTYKKESAKLYHEGAYEFIKSSNGTISDILMEEYSHICNLPEEDLIVHLNNTKDKIKEENCIVFIQGKGLKDVRKLPFETNKVEFNPIQLEYTTSNKYTLQNPDIYYIIKDFYPSEFRKEYYKYNWYYLFLNKIFKESRLLLDIPNKIGLYFHDLDGNEELLSDEMIKGMTDPNNEVIKSYYRDLKAEFLNNYSDFFNSCKTDIIAASEIFIKSRIIYSPSEAEDVLKEVFERPIEKFLYDIDTLLLELRGANRVLRGVIRND